MKRSLDHPLLRLGVLIGLLLCNLTELHGAPDFTASEISVERETVVEGEVARFKLILRNQGDAPAEAAQVRIQSPVMGHLVEVTGVEDVRTDHEARVVTGSVSLPAGGERTVEVMVLAPRDSAGSALSLTAQLIHYHTMAETWIHKTISIDTRIKSDGIHVGGLRIAPAGVVTLLWMLATAVAVVMVGLIAGHRRQGSFAGPISGAVGIMIAIGFWLLFVVMAWRDYRALTEWIPSTATIIGQRVHTQSVSSSQRRNSGSGMESRQTDVSKPEFALRYTVDGRERLSTGYDTGSSLRRGGKAQLEKEFREWTVGAQIPCWYDPRDPADVVVKRGFGGAYLFALLPLIPFWIGWWLLRRGLSKAG
jgi:hypothetical protein